MEESEAIKVLLVDDEERYRITTAHVLENRGFLVRAVASGREALEEIKKSDLDVVVLDIKMPGMDGHRTLREINKLKSDVEVIILTAHVSMDSAFEGLRDDAFAYLSKPFEIEGLMLIIREAYDRKRDISGREDRVSDIEEPLSASIETNHQKL